MSIEVQHHPEQRRFEAAVDGHRGHLEFRILGTVMTIVHTEVDPGLEGRGVAGELVRNALAHARAEGLEVDFTCAYARAWMERHSQSQDLHV